MWKHRTRRGAKNKEDDRGIEENIIEVHHPKEGLMVYRPSSSLMPARPLGAPLDETIVTPVVKTEIEDNETEAKNNFNVIDQVIESSILETSKMIDFHNTPTEIALNNKLNAPKIQIKTEPIDDVSDNTESIVGSDNIVSESSPVKEENMPELNQKPPNSHEVDNVHKNLMGGQNSLALWDLGEMFPDVSSKNIEDKSPDSNIDSQITFTPFKRTYINFCLELSRTDIEECVGYLNSSFPGIHRNSLFSLEVPQKNNTSTAANSASEETVSSVVRDRSPEKPISKEDLKKILEVSNLRNTSSETLPGQSNSSNSAGSSGLKEIFNIKKEPVSPKKAVPCSHLVDAGKGSAIINSDSIISKIQPVSQGVISEVPEVSVTSKELSRKRKMSHSVELETPVTIKKERFSPEKDLNNFGESSKKRKSSFDINVNEAKKHIKKEPVPVENVHLVSEAIEAARFEETNDVVAPKQTVLETKISYNPNSSLTTMKTTQQNNRIDSHVIKHIKKEPVPVENVPLISKAIEAARFEETNDVVAPKQTVLETKISYNPNSSLSTMKTTQQNNRIVSHISSLSATNDTSSVIDQYDDTTSLIHIPLNNKSSDVDLKATKMALEKEAVVQKKLEDAGVRSLTTVKDTPIAIRQNDRTSSLRLTPATERFFKPNEANVPTKFCTYNSIEEAPQKKKKLTPQEYLRRQSNSASSNSAISKYSSPQVSLNQPSVYPPINPLDQMSQMDNFSEFFGRDPRLQKSVASTPSVSSVPSSHNIPPYEIGQNVYTPNARFSHVPLKSAVPISRERLSSQEFKEPLKMPQISQCDARSQNDFEPRRSCNSSSIKIQRENIGLKFIDRDDVTRLILEWDVSWLESQRRNNIVPQIIRQSYPEVKNTYHDIENFYNTYLPLHILNIWMSMYKSWEQQDFLPDSILEESGGKSAYVTIRCSMILKPSNQNILPKTEDIVICHVDGHTKKLFGIVDKVCVENTYNSLLGAKLDIVFAENFDTHSRRPLGPSPFIKIQKLNNIRTAIHVCDALKSINSFMCPLVLNPKKECSRIKVIHTQPFISHSFIKNNMRAIMMSAESRRDSVTLVHTLKPSDSFKAITLIVPEVVDMKELIFVCMKEEAIFLEMASDLKKYNPVLAVREGDMPRLPRELAGRTVSRLEEEENGLRELERCQVVLTLMPALYLGELENRLLRDKNKHAMCLIPEAHHFLETETTLLLEHDFRSLILIGRKVRIEDMEARLKRQSFDKSLFYRIFESVS